MIAAIMAAALAKGVSARAGQAVTLYGDDDYPPYSYSRDGVPQGVYVQILREAFARMPEYDLTIQLVPWRRGLKMLEQGEAVGLFPPYARPEERPFIGAYSAPLGVEAVVVYCLEAAAAAVEGKPFPAGYEGLTFANNAGFKVAGPDFETMRRLGRITVNESAGTDLNVKKLLAGRAQCYVNDRLSIQLALRANGSDGRSVRETAVVREERAYVGWSHAALGALPWLPALVQRLDTVLVEMAEDGSLLRLVRVSGG